MGKICPLQNSSMRWLPKNLDGMTVLRRKEINATQPFTACHENNFLLDSFGYEIFSNSL
jgi:hypothetical protein